MQTPFVYQEGEFNRALHDFGKPVTDRSHAVVCYTKSGATPAEVRALAEGACAAVGKAAVFSGHELVSECPLMTPSAARFSCIHR